MSKQASKPDLAQLVKVTLKCTYSGFPGDPGPGSVIEIDAAEAQRLIDAGAATAVAPDPVVEAGPGPAAGAAAATAATAASDAAAEAAAAAAATAAAAAPDAAAEAAAAAAAPDAAS